ncbi:MAG: HAD family hydrolase [Cyanobacteria bacterium J06623_7]
MPIAIACPNLTYQNIAAVIFDKDGTLENSRAYWRLVGSERARLIDAQIPGVGEPLMMAFGIIDNSLNPQGLMAVGSREENEIAAAAYIAETGRSWSESREIARSAFAEVAESKYLIKTAKSAPLYDDARELLATLHRRGLKIGILSADSTTAVENFVAEHQLENLIQLCMGTDRSKSKPNPQLLLQACKDLNVLPEETLMVGDATVDMIMAQTARVAGAIGICRDESSTLPEADTQITTLRQIQTL